VVNGTGMLLLPDATSIPCCRCCDYPPGWHPDYTKLTIHSPMPVPYRSYAVVDPTTDSASGRAEDSFLFHTMLPQAKTAVVSVCVW